VFGRGFYDYLGGEPEKAERFNAALTAVSRAWISEVLQAIDFEGIRTVMDVAGGHGLFLAELLKAHPQVQGILVDQASVLARAKQKNCWMQREFKIDVYWSRLTFFSQYVQARISSRSAIF
jgi:hypothetical protein